MTVNNKLEPSTAWIRGGHVYATDYEYIRNINTNLDSLMRFQNVMMTKLVKIETDIEKIKKHIKRQAQAEEQNVKQR